ncbi:3'(2'),5'-bisphosphate nucleotidase [Microcoleus sp. FACHB-53]|nr:3'(2'),5'-bisphosphate nucleotidase [Microcoleus sp. FACHB-53]MBD2130409.1 3'(2'),5'-bisphosphate nucleotidase [Microcoleus sp. FACHB-1]
MLYEREKQVAIAAVVTAGKLCEQVRREQGSLAIAKPDRTPVTVADFSAQAIICQALGEAFPNDPVIGEEDSTLLRTQTDQLARVTQYVQAYLPSATPESVATWIDRGNAQVKSRYWTLDPIDGTKGYIRGDQYAIALALVEAGELKLGLLGCPALPVDLTQPDGERGVLFVAVRGQGATMIPLAGGAPRPLRVTDASEESLRRLAKSIVSEHSNPTLQEAVVQAIGLTAPPWQLDSQAKYGVVARGEAALYLRLPFPITSEKRQNTWDHAAGVIMVEEAGGRVTDMYGQPLDFSFGAKLVNNQGIIASNGLIHEAVLAAVAKMAKES